MDKLSAALERARNEKQGNIGRLRREQGNGRPQPAAPEPTATPAAEEVPVTTDQAEAQISLDAITYLQTRLIELDPDVLEHNRVIASRSDDERVEAYRHLRTQVLQLFARHDWKSLAVTSPHENAGKTLTSINLAISLAHEVTHSVLLVDLDLRKPNVHTTLGVDVDVGITDVVQGNAKVSDALFNPRIPRLVVMPGRPLGKHASEMLTTPAMQRLLAELKHRYSSRLVIFDLPPLLRNDDALKFTPYADATLLVVEEGVSTAEDVERSQHLLRNANLVGTILNKAR